MNEFTSNDKEKLMRQSEYAPFRFNVFVKAFPIYRKAIVTVSAVFFCMFMAMPILAANIPLIYNLMYKVSPGTAQFFMPVQRSCENNGIRMEVVSTYIHDDTVEIYIALQDLTDNRVDSTTDLYDSYSIHRPFDSSGYCERVGYDEDTKTATFLIRITEWGNRNIEGDKITFSVKCFISDKHAYKDIFLDIPFDNLSNGVRTKEVNITGGGGDFGFMANDTATTLDVKNILLSPVDGIDITGIGYVDGKLHVQTSILANFKNDNYGYVFLKDKSGFVIECDYSVSFAEYTTGNTGTRLDFYEYIFSVPQHEIQDFDLYGSFYTSGNYTEGNWQVTFPLLESEEK